ncbi:MAG: hypothetical protein GY868_20190 [Deltaproteobacteria bacterium]|nr:hypothetical protein [Deltaproteobacteria bacterium]
MKNLASRILNKENNGDDNFGWLITFADLMTILLVFSFAMFAALNKNDSFLQSLFDGQEQQKSSGVPLAHAKAPAVNKNTVSIPLHLIESMPQDLRTDEENKIIISQALSLSDRQVSSDYILLRNLNRLLEMAENNPTSKIIVKVQYNTTNSAGLKHGARIADFLSTQQKINSNRVFLQKKYSSNQPSDMEPQNSVEVQLVKAFWAL